MKLLTILQALALLILAVFGAAAGNLSSADSPASGACPVDAPSVACDL